MAVLNGQLYSVQCDGNLCYDWCDLVATLRLHYAVCHGSFSVLVDASVSVAGTFFALLVLISLQRQIKSD